jgi:hypothetical protein
MRATPWFIWELETGACFAFSRRLVSREEESDDVRPHAGIVEPRKRRSFMSTLGSVGIGKSKPIAPSSLVILRVLLVPALVLLAIYCFQFGFYQSYFPYGDDPALFNASDGNPANGLPKDSLSTSWSTRNGMCRGLIFYGQASTSSFVSTTLSSEITTPLISRLSTSHNSWFAFWSFAWSRQMGVNEDGCI